MLSRIRCLVIRYIGERQAGKSTMLKHMAQEQLRMYVTIDDEPDRELAAADPVLFFSDP